ncbi:MAG TPA: glycerate kinase [Chitinophagaceae bacterium]|nr:glycerate kinase [Chitinophagaceae bacterium]
MHILIAPNAFKNSLNAADAAEAIEHGLLQSKLRCTCMCFPVADGGDGTAALLIEKFNGTIIHTEVYDPLKRKINASFGLIDKGATAVIELADASGLRLLHPEEYDPLHASTFGTGEMIKHALDKGVNKIIIGIGGSATVDGATGILQALGIRFLDVDKKVLQHLPESLIGLAFIDTTNIDKRIFNVELIVLCDVENMLLGETGAATVFGPQKGASAEDVKKLEAALTRFRDITFQQTGKDMAAIKHGGAAGGVAAGLAVFLNAKLVNGIDYFLEITSFGEALQKADLVITGEGSIDEQTLHGKGPFGVAKKAKQKNIPVIGLAGKIPLQPDAGLKKYFDVLMPINNELSLEKALLQTKDNLMRTAAEIGNLLALKLGF